MLIKLFILLTFIFALVVSSRIECTKSGYVEYLNNRSYKFDGSMDDYIESNLNIFITNCNKLHYRQDMEDVSDVTILLDWSDDELEQLGSLSTRFRGVSLYNEPVTTTIAEYSLIRTLPHFPDVFLSNFSQKTPICSTSWLTSILEVAQTTMDNKFVFSVEQLVQCLPIYGEFHSICDGVSPSLLMNYLSEVGLVLDSDFSDCHSIANQSRVRFSILLPEVPNKSGLINLVAAGKPVFVMVALDLKKLRYVKDMSHIEKPFRSSYSQPTVYGIVSGYKSECENPYWEITSRILPYEEMTVRVPMSECETDANYAGIAGYAFTVKPKSVLYFCTPSKCPTVYDIPVEVTDLVFKEGTYPRSDLFDLSRFVSLEKVTFERGSVLYCDQLRIHNNALHSVIIDDYSLSVSVIQSERRLNALSFFFYINAPKLEHFIVGEGSCQNMKEIIIEDTVGDVNVKVGKGSFANVDEIRNDEESEDFANKLRNAIGKANEKPTEDPNMEVPTEIPSNEVPTTEIPTTEIPTTEIPTTEIPTTEIPTTEVPTTEIPTTEIPTTEIPTTEVPTTEIPTTEIPTTEIPTTEIPTTEIPTTEIPTTEIPTTEIPTTEIPTTEIPTTEIPTTEIPTTEIPTTEIPTTEIPTTEIPTTEIPTTEIPTTEIPTTEIPTTEIPTTEVPTTEVPTTEIPTTEIPTTEIPTTEIPTTEIPTTEIPTTEIPTTAIPTTEIPTTVVPTTEVPTLFPPTSGPSLGDLNIKVEEDCEKIYDNNWSSITIGNYLCNSLTRPLSLVGNHHITSFSIGTDSLQNIASLEINNNYALNKITFNQGSFNHTTSVIIKSIYYPYSSHYNYQICRHSQWERIHFTLLHPSFFKVGVYTLSYLDLPILSSFVTADYSFYSAQQFTITSI